MKKTRLSCLIPHPNRASSRLRVLNAAPHLEKQGISVSTELFVADKDTLGFIKLYLKLKKQTDVLLIQKKIHFSWWQRKLLRNISDRILFDYDDSVMFVELTQGKTLNGKNLQAFTQTMKICDVAIACSEFLISYAKACNVESHTLPTPIDQAFYDGSATDFKASTEDSRVRIGWVGSRGNLKEVTWISEELQALAKQRDFELVIICDETIEIPGVNIQFAAWSLEDEYRHIAGTDIGIMPLRSNDLRRKGKCAYKAIQFMYEGKPVVASAVGFNNEVIQHGENGLLVEDKSQFVDALKQLIDDSEMRKKLGNNAKQHSNNVIDTENYSRQLASKF